MTDWFISAAPERVQLDTVYPWLRGSYWSPDIRRDVVARAFANSVVVGAYRGDAQIGVARAATDQATFAWLCDVFVDESARGQGIATAMVRALIADPRLQTLRRWALATRDAHPVYQPLGFAPCDAALWMTMSPDPARWKTPA